MIITGHTQNYSINPTPTDIWQNFAMQFFYNNAVSAEIKKILLILEFMPYI